MTNRSCLLTFTRHYFEQILFKDTPPPNRANRTFHVSGRMPRPAQVAASPNFSCLYSTYTACCKRLEKRLSCSVRPQDALPRHPLVDFLVVCQSVRCVRTAAGRTLKTTLACSTTHYQQDHIEAWTCQTMCLPRLTRVKLFR